MKTSVPVTMALLAAVGLSAAACSPSQPPIPVSSAPSGPPPPTDPQIAHIAYTADNIDIRNGRLALQKSRSPQVRAFANDMVRDHTKVNNQALALLKQLGVQPEDNDTSRVLTQAADSEYTKLQALRGPAFDREYATNELAYHQQVNAALAQTLIPNAKNPQLKDLLQSAAPIFQEHEQHAQMLVDRMGSTTATSPTSRTNTVPSSVNNVPNNTGGPNSNASDVKNSTRQ